MIASDCTVCHRRGVPLAVRGKCKGCYGRTLKGRTGPVDWCAGCGGVNSCDCIVCWCPNPQVDGLGECQSCHRKPVFLLGVIGRSAIADAMLAVAS